MNDQSEADRSLKLKRYARIAFALVAAWYVGRPVVQPFDYVILRDIILATHEAGHVLFMPFGEFLMVLGGSLFQVLVPCAFVAYFARRRDWYGAAIMVFWVAFALTDLALYIGDAGARQLPLLGGDPGAHDWTFLLVQTGLLEEDWLIAGVVRALGVVLYVTAVAASLYTAWWLERLQQPAPVPTETATPEDARLDPPARGPSMVTAARWRER